jgi:membrane protease YdiL (CAAX protease family)/GNAT superfamily N-acetyltransferase
VPAQFRSATGADAAAIASLVNRAYRPLGQSPGWTHEAHLVEGDRISVAGVEALLAPGSVVLVASEGEAIIGCVHIESRGDQAYIGMLTTEPARQAQGLGRQLLWQAERCARKHLRATGFRMSVLEARHDLLAYYARRGYEPTGESEPFHASCGVGELRVPGLRVLTLAKRVPPWWRRAMHSRWASLPLGLLCVLLPVMVFQWGLQALHPPKGAGVAAATIAIALVGLLGYVFYVRTIERRRVTELARAQLLRELSLGLAFGAGLFLVTVGVLAQLGAFRVTGHGAALVMLMPFGLAVASGVIEELLFRGLIFRLVERSFGTWIALSCSAVLFGLVHLSNPHPTLAGAVAIIFEAGILLAAAYLYTRRLWLPIGLHAAWNFTQGGVFGVAVSGNATEGWLHGSLSGPDWLTGGNFGAEGSVVALLACVIAGLLLLRAAWLRGHFLTLAGQRARYTLGIR